MSEERDDPAAELAARIGRAVRMERHRQGLTQTELARRIGRAPAHLSRLESGNAMPSSPLLVDVALGLGVSVEYLACPLEDPLRERLRKPWPERGFE